MVTPASRASSEPGHRQPAPGDLALVQAFVNTNDVEAGSDQLSGPEDLLHWLVRRGVRRQGRRVSEAGWRRAIAVREGLRALAAANNDLPLESDALRRLHEAAGQLALVPRLEVGSRWRLQARAGGVDGFLERLLSITVAAMADGTWERMKACQADSCRWLFYDGSRNRSSTWCSMAVCGARAKARAYRVRKRGAGSV